MTEIQRSVETSLLIRAAPARVLAAFFDPLALAAWWQVTRSVTTPRPLGIYAVEWAPTPFADELLGPLGGVFYGIVMDYRPGRECFIADAYWLPPEGEPIGPMALEVRCRLEGAVTRLTVRQSGYEPNERWDRYYNVIEQGWQTSLDTLKRYLEGADPAERTGVAKVGRSPDT